MVVDADFSVCADELEKRDMDVAATGVFYITSSPT